MSPLYNVLLTKTVKNLQHTTGKYAKEKIDISNILKVLLPLYSEYCKEVSGAKCHIGCPDAITLFYEENQYPFKLANFRYNGRALYTANGGPNITKFLSYSKGKTTKIKQSPWDRQSRTMPIICSCILQN